MSRDAAVRLDYHVEAGTIGETRMSAFERSAALRPLPPFGRAVEEFVATAGTPPDGIDLFICEDYPRGRDVWQQLSRGQKYRGAGSGMVLPPGESIESFRWPRIPLNAIDRPQIVVWAFNLSCAQIYDVSQQLLAAGYRCVDVRGSMARDESGKPICPARFTAEHKNGIPLR